MQSFKKRVTILGGLAMAATLTVGTVTTLAQSAPEIKWETSLATAQEKAKTSGKLILLDVYAPWSGPCKKMNKETYADPAVVEESRKWIMLRIDGDQDKSISKKYNVKDFPTTVFMKPDGSALSILIGYADAQTMLKKMRAFHPETRK